MTDVRFRSRLIAQHHAGGTILYLGAMDGFIPVLSPLGHLGVL